MAGDKIISPDFFVFSRTEDTNSNAYSNYQGVFKACWDHLKYLEGLGITTEIARNTGSFTNGRGGGTGWWDQADRFGQNGWACFRWNSNSNRSWEWYMLIQNCDQTGPSGPGAPGFSVPGTGNTRGFHLATAISISGSTTENPWGGTTGSLNADTKGSPVWVTSSVDYKLFIFPDANGVSGVLANGVTSTDREGLVFDSATGGNAAHRRAHFISDDDTFIYLRNNEDTNWTMMYCGLFEPFTEVTKNSSGVESNLPYFVCFKNTWSPSTYPGADPINMGSLTTNPGSNEQGAVIVPHETDSQMRGIRLLTVPDPDNWESHRTNYSGGVLNPRGVLYDFVFSLTPPDDFGTTTFYQGPIGKFDPNMLQIAAGFPSFVRINNTQYTKIVLPTDDLGINRLVQLAVPWHPNAPMMERRDRFVENRRFTVTSSTS